MGAEGGSLGMGQRLKHGKPALMELSPNLYALHNSGALFTWNVQPVCQSHAMHVVPHTLCHLTDPVIMSEQVAWPGGLSRGQQRPCRLLFRKEGVPVGRTGNELSELVSEVTLLCSGTTDSPTNLP